MDAQAQLLLALVIVALAVGFLAREGWRRARRSDAGGCGGCASAGSCTPRPLTGPERAGMKRLPGVDGPPRGGGGGPR